VAIVNGSARLGDFARPGLRLVTFRHGSASVTLGRGSAITVQRDWLRACYGFDSVTATASARRPLRCPPRVASRRSSPHEAGPFSTSAPAPPSLRARAPRRSVATTPAAPRPAPDRSVALPAA